MTLSLITPGVLPLTLDQVKDHLRLESDDTAQDALIMGYLRAAVAHVEGRGIALCTQTWELSLDAFPPDVGERGLLAINLYRSPVQSVSSIKYITADGEQTLDADAYNIRLGGRLPSRILPVYGSAWPYGGSNYDQVAVRFVAGYLDWNSPRDTRNGVPEDLKAALLLLVGHWFENREAVNIGNISSEVPLGVEALLQNYRIYAI